MHDVDFLPTQYRQQHLRRRSQPWQAVVALAFFALLVGAGFAQHRQRQRIESDLEAVEPQYQTALERQQRLSELQQRLTEVRAEAELLAYLRHPWPRTQLLAAVAGPLPEEITLQQVQIRRAAPRQPSGERPTRAEAEQEEKKLAGLAPAAQDLAELRKELDGARTVVTLAGITRQSAPLHRYLGELAEHPLIDKTELGAIENVEGAGEPTLRFEATLLVRPGYGQPGGPTASGTEADNPATSEADDVATTAPEGGTP
jgi:hypothetical protein